MTQNQRTVGITDSTDYTDSTDLKSIQSVKSNNPCKSVIQTGYKQTEVGVIPDDWDVVDLKSVAINMVQGINTAIDKPEYVCSGIPMLKANNIIDQEVIFDGADQVSFKTYAGYSDRYRLKKNDFLFSNIGARLGTGSLLKVDLECTFAWNVLRIVPNTKKIVPQYLSSMINSPRISQGIINNQSGSGMGFVPKGMMEKVLFPLPPSKAEQEAIAEALSDTDALIESLEQLITKKRQIKQGAMQELLTGKRKAIDSGELIIDNGRPTGVLGDLFVYRPARGNNSAENFVTFLGMEDVSEQGHIIQQTVIPKHEVRKGLTYFERCDVLVAKITPCFENGKGAFLGDLSTRCGAGSTEFHVLRAKSDVDPLYVYYHTRMPEFRIKLEGEMIGTAGQKRVPIAAIVNYPLSIIHSKAEQTAIATILSDMDAEITTLETKLVKTRQLKQGMMHNLLTGRIRLTVESGKLRVESEA
jgi:type I restriction enzyme S subunit